jgi:hypothetical protein
MTNSSAESHFFSNMTAGQIIDYCRQKAGNWKKVPKDRITEDTISAIINTYPNGIDVIYTIQTNKRNLHIEYALFKWKSKALEYLRKEDYPRNESIICALISEDPNCYTLFPREHQTQAVVDAAILADLKLFKHIPDELITEQHILMLTEKNPDLLKSTLVKIHCTLSPDLIDKMIEKAPIFLLNSGALCQLDKQQIFRIADQEKIFWSQNRLPLKESIELISQILNNPDPKAGSMYVIDTIKSIRNLGSTLSISNILQISEIRKDICLTALDINDPVIFGEHVRKAPDLMPFYQQWYGSEAAMKLTETAKLRKGILERDLGL